MYMIRLRSLTLMLLLSFNLSATQQGAKSVNDQLLETIGDGNTEKIESLLKLGANANARDTEGTTPLMEAAWLNDLAEVKLLLSRGAEINAIRSDGESALPMAIVTMPAVNPADILAVVQVLVQNGAYLQIHGLRGKTPLMLAAGNDDLLSVLRFLLSKGAQIEARDNAGDTALAWSAQNIQVADMAALLLRGAKVDTRNDKGTTPLMYAAGTGNLQTVKLLLSHGADPTLKDNSGKTAVDYARNEHDLSPAAKAKVLALLRTRVPK